MSHVLKVDQIHAYYGAAHILHGLSLEIKAGERVALIGRNGVGKTTLVNSLFGFAHVRSGSMEVCGNVLRKPKAYQAPNLGMALVPQGRCIIANLTVEENLILGSAVRRRGPWHLEKIYELFPILKERAHTSGTALSGGQQQMLAIGRALMANPELIILDEPTEGLAPVIVDQLADIFNAVADQGSALLLIEQNLSLVSRVCQRYYAVAKGQVVEKGRVDPSDIESLREHVVV